MPTRSNHLPPEHDWRTERTVVLMVLDKSGQCSLAQLHADLRDIDQEKVGRALIGLEARGVVIMEGDLVWASKCARHLDALDLIAV